MYYSVTQKQLNLRTWIIFKKRYNDRHLFSRPTYN